MLRNYIFNNKEDHIFYFNYLIQEVLNFNMQFKDMLNDINQLEDSLGEESLIEVIKFEALSRRKDGILRFLCNLFADETKGAISFKKYRKKLKKDANKYGVNLPELPSAISEKLNFLNQLRNWSLHYPESLIISERALLKKEILSDVIYSVNYQYYERQYLTEMISELTELYNYFVEISKQMIEDYALLIGKKVSIVNCPITIKEYNLMQAVSDSWDIQTS